MKARRKDEDHKFDGENMTVINFLMPKKKKNGLYSIDSGAKLKNHKQEIDKTRILS